MRLEYPLIEAEVARRHVAEWWCRRPAPAPGRRRRWRRAWAGGPTWSPRWRTGSNTIGLLHADATASGRTVDALDAEVVGSYAEGLSGVFERAVLRHTLELHRAELQRRGAVDRRAAEPARRCRRVDEPTPRARRRRGWWSR